MTTQLSPSAAGLPLFRLSVAQYHAMRDAGILGEDDRLELLSGLLVTKMTKKPPHSIATELARKAIEQVVGDGYHVRSQEPVTTSDSEPEPDVALVRGDVRDYLDRHPRPEDVVLIVEVADDSLRRDRTEKLAIYARAGIAHYWIVNLRERQLEVYGEPDGEGYRHRAELAPGDLAALGIDGHEVARIAVSTLLP